MIVNLPDIWETFVGERLEHIEGAETRTRKSN